MKARKFKVRYSNEVLKTIEEHKDDKKFQKLMKEAIKKLKRNPYASEQIDASFFDKIKNKILWLRREIELKLWGE